MNLLALIIPAAIYKKLYEKNIPKELQKKELTEDEKDALEDYKTDNSY